MIAIYRTLSLDFLKDWLHLMWHLNDLIFSIFKSTAARLFFHLFFDLVAVVHLIAKWVKLLIREAIFFVTCIDRFSRRTIFTTSAAINPSWHHFHICGGEPPLISYFISWFFWLRLNKPLYLGELYQLLMSFSIILLTLFWHSLRGLPTATASRSVVAAESRDWRLKVENELWRAACLRYHVSLRARLLGQMALLTASLATDAKLNVVIREGWTIIIIMYFVVHFNLF